MATVNQRSRQQRALAQRERELKVYEDLDELPPKPEPDEAFHTPPGIPWRNHTTVEDKAQKARQDIENLKAKLNKQAQAA